MVLQISRKNFKILDFFANFENYGEFWKISNYNFQSRRQIMTTRGVYIMISTLKILSISRLYMMMLIFHLKNMCHNIEKKDS